MLQRRNLARNGRLRQMQLFRRMGKRPASAAAWKIRSLSQSSGILTPRCALRNQTGKVCDLRLALQIKTCQIKPQVSKALVVTATVPRQLTPTNQLGLKNK